jgi:hypothetical protein
MADARDLFLGRYDPLRRARTLTPCGSDSMANSFDASRRLGSIRSRGTSGTSRGRRTLDFILTQ